MEIRDAFTFDDVLLEPAESRILPSEANTSTKLTRSINLGIPLMAAAMDTVTEAEMGIALAQAGGLGVIHKNLEPEEQANEVRKVKRFESGMVVNPITIYPDQTLADALAIMDRESISGIPVIAREGGQLVGIVTNRDVRFASDPAQPIRELMTEELVTVDEGVDMSEAKQLLHRHRIEKLLVVDSENHCVGLITVKDIEKAQAYPDACKDSQGRLRVAAATGVGDSGYERAEAL
ncbi:MAG: IMP dehydrogenase, partial [Alphaproteobacteria bacterium]|nr:IMP dehydrogenase [Alphaproteobacteria bacterium]